MKQIIAVIISVVLVASGATNADLPAAYASPSTSQSDNLVRNLYRDFLGRNANSTEANFWANEISSGRTSQEWLARTLSTSDEWIQNVIRGFYLDTLGREPDASGYEYWINQARSGKPIADIGSFFYGSDEYFAGYGQSNNTAWITDLYQKLMSRLPDSGGLSFWVSQLQSGMSRPAVSHWFYQSPEKRGLRVDALYTKFLKRNSDTGGRAYWANVLANSGDLALASFLASSPEYLQRLFVQSGSASLTASTRIIRPGQTIVVSGSGYLSGSTIDLSIHSDPRDLGDLNVDGSGEFSATVLIPADMPPGEHTLVADGLSSSGEIISSQLGVSLDATGPDIVSVLPSSGTYTVGDTFTVRISVTDPSGIQSVNFSFSDSQSVQRDFCGQSMSVVSGAGTSSQVWEYSCTVPQNAINETYTITPFARDLVGNYTNTNGGTSDSSRGSFTVVGGSSDVVGPDIVSVLPSSGTYTVGDTFTVRISVTDPSGIQSVNFSFSDSQSVQRDFCGQSMSVVSGAGTSSQVWEYSCTVPGGTLAEDYTITPFALDQAGNYTNTNGGTSDSSRGYFSIR